MKSFLDSNFLLQSETAQKLYHEHAAKMPIIDYHCHLIPQQIADNYQFADLTEIWLGGDHYKWRAMRANGVPETYITGDKPAYEKFEKWAETLQYAMRNPLYHWTHLELSRIFGIDKVLNPSTAREIYDECTAKLQTPEFRAQAIMERMNVEVVCTTDDPIDDLKYHTQIRQSSLKTKVLPAWRPDKAMAIENVDTYNEYLTKLEAAADMSILNFKNLIDALQKRHDFFASQGCRLSDHGILTFYAEPYTDAEIEAIFLKARMKKELTVEEIDKFRSAMLYEFAVMDAKSDWVQQFHYGATRNNNVETIDGDATNVKVNFDGDPVTTTTDHKVWRIMQSTGTANSVIATCGSPVSNTDGRHSFVFYGVENPLYGNQWRFECDWKLVDGVPYWCDDPTKYSWTSNDGYIALDTMAMPDEGWATALQQDDRALSVQITKSVGGSSGTHLADYFWINKSGIRIALRGGPSGNGGNAGPFVLYLSRVAGDAWWSIGGDLSIPG